MLVTVKSTKVKKFSVIRLQKIQRVLYLCFAAANIHDFACNLVLIIGHQKKNLFTLHLLVEQIAISAGFYLPFLVLVVVNFRGDSISKYSQTCSNIPSHDKKI